VAGVAGQFLDLVDEVVAEVGRPGVVDAEPRGRGFGGRRARVRRGEGGHVGAACVVERGDGADRGLTVGQGEARRVRRVGVLVDLDRRAAVTAQPCRRAPHHVGDVLDQPADRQRAAARPQSGLLVGQADRRRPDGGELLVDVAHQAGDLVVACRFVHRHLQWFSGVCSASDR
jgi:hypothetical protein